MDFPFEKEAMRGEKMPHGLDLVDSMAYQFFALLYRRYYSQHISREQAKKEKGDFMYQYRKYKEKSETESKLCEWRSNAFRACEIAANDYARERTLENADGLYRALYGVSVGIKENEVFYENQG